MFERKSNTREIDDLTAKHIRELEDMKHFVKMRQEALEVEYKKKELDLEKNYNTRVASTAHDVADGLREVIQRYEVIMENLLLAIPSANISTIKKGK